MKPSFLALAAGAAALALAVTAGSGPAAAAPGPPAAERTGAPLPARMADTGGGSQLITAVAPKTSATHGRLVWWEKRHGHWERAGSAPARFGAKGVTEGSTREQGTNTTPTGLYDLPYGFGISAAPPGTEVGYRPVHDDSWWCEDNASTAYNRWAEPLPADCAAKESERLADYPTQYDRALVIGFNYDEPVRGRGAGIFLHVNGKGATAGCVSVPADAMARILAWADPDRRPHIAIGTKSGDTAITRY
ncbi:L,D-transpeptidase family protein [Streptomyces sp. NPDC042319]|uniref:L,D-transpeptidase family protein n=1 Tax=Streptomyces sp. NPDC042319 TaxID=3154332 RepID=UPI0033F4DE9A